MFLLIFSMSKVRFAILPLVVFSLNDLNGPLLHFHNFEGSSIVDVISAKNNIDQGKDFFFRLNTLDTEQARCFPDAIRTISNSDMFDHILDDTEKASFIEAMSYRYEGIKLFVRPRRLVLDTSPHLSSMLVGKPYLNRFFQIKPLFS